MSLNTSNKPNPSGVPWDAHPLEGSHFDLARTSESPTELKIDISQPPDVNSELWTTGPGHQRPALQENSKESYKNGNWFFTHLLCDVNVKLVLWVVGSSVEWMNPSEVSLGMVGAMGWRFLWEAWVPCTPKYLNKRGLVVGLRAVVLNLWEVTWRSQIFLHIRYLY